ncbi:MAG: potassium-transporting ATPase subunit KdpA, partial [Propionicimonas sp.]|nr:potassium-transporting ATPase subunit KdpA [Propionicimonas sp.]
MSDGLSLLLTLGVVVAVLAAAHVPLGDHLARVLTDTRHGRVERGVYRLAGVDPDADQTWVVYARCVLGFSFVSLLALYGLQRLQFLFPAPFGQPAVEPLLAWNTAVSFVTNTNWQNYAGESTMGFAVQMAGLAVQNFTSAAAGIAVAAALVRGLARSGTRRVGNFWTDLVRVALRVLLPLAAVLAVVLLATGVIQNLSAPLEVTTLGGGVQSIPGGPVASQEAIKELGTNGGGFFNANSAHPFENPTGGSNLLQVIALLLIPSALPRALGTMVGDRRQGFAILAAMAVLWAGSVVSAIAFEYAGGAPAPLAAGAAMEGKETRFGIGASALFAASTTATSTGAVNAMHDSLTPLGGAVAIVNMLLGEVSPGGTGSGLYGMLVLAVVTVFVAGLMVGRTPEYLGKKIAAREIKFAALYLLATPALVLVGTAVALATPAATDAILNPGPHGLSEVLYGFASAANNNGSAFAGLAANTPFYNLGLGLAMAFGRFLPILLVLGLAGSLAAQSPVPVTAGT